MSGDRPTRRRLLATSGLVAAGSTAGCGRLLSAFDDASAPPMDDAATPVPRTVTDPKTVEYGQAVTGTLRKGDGIDPQYGDLAEPVTFSGTAGDVVEITMTAPGFTPFLVLEGPNARVVGIDGDADETTRSVIWRRLPTSGRFVAWAGSYAGDATGEYTLSVEESDARAAFADVPTIELGDTHEGRVTGPPPVDPAFGDVAAPVGVALPAPTVVELELRAPSFAPMQVIEGATGNLLGLGDAGDEGHSTLQLRLTGGTNVVWARSESGTDTGAFTLSTRRL